jgi:peptidoglycan/LPS O-acetylase OafA/YrhL
MILNLVKLKVRFNQFKLNMLLNLRKILDPWLTAFSLKHNTEQLISMRDIPGDIKSAHGLRFISVILIVIAHKGEVMLFNPFINRNEMSSEITGMTSVLSRSSVLFTDTFLLLSGMLTAYSFVGRLQKGRPINQLKELTGRYIR